MTDKTNSLLNKIVTIVNNDLPVPPISDQETVELFHGFKWDVSPATAKAYREWREKIESDNAPQGAARGRFTFEITPTSIGDLVFVRDDITKERFDLNEYGWF